MQFLGEGPDSPSGRFKAQDWSTQGCFCPSPGGHRRLPEPHRPGPDEPGPCPGPQQMSRGRVRQEEAFPGGEGWPDKAGAQSLGRGKSGGMEAGHTGHHQISHLERSPGLRRKWIAGRGTGGAGRKPENEEVEEWGGGGQGGWGGWAVPRPGPWWGGHAPGGHVLQGE